MRISTFWYCLKQGIINICRNILFSLASIATISACIFLFCLFFSLAANVIHGARTAQETVGISVFFDEGMTEDEILAAGEEIKGWKEVRQAEYTSARKPGIHLRLSTLREPKIWPKGLKTIILWQILLPLRFF